MQHLFWEKKAELNEHIAAFHEGKNKVKSLPLTNDRLQTIKQQCARHSLSQLARFFPLDKKTLKRKLIDYT